MKIGPYEGELAPAFHDDEMIGRLAQMPALLASSGPMYEKGEVSVRRIRLPWKRRELDLAVKSQAPQFLLKDLIDRKIGTVSKRAWLPSIFLREKKIGTPEPVGYLDRWEGARLVESHFIAVYEENIGNFRDELIHLFRHEPDCDKVLALMEAVARSVKSLHDAGVRHGDLGNQNILLRRKGPAAWGDVQFTDLNRARIIEPMSLKHRAFDLSRIYLPSDFLRIFFEMYFAGPPPETFMRHEAAYRRRFAWHTKSRIIRRPFRTLQRRRNADPRIQYPAPEDIWIWDEKSAQAVNALRRTERKARHPIAGHLKTVAATVAGFVPVHREYRKLLAAAFQARIPLQDRVGIAIEPRPGLVDRELAALRELGRIPVLMRLYHHKGPEQWALVLDTLKQLRGEKYSVALALVQDRRAVIEPARWAEFCRRIVEEAAGNAEWIEVGHAVNRVKWGIWHADEYRRLLDPLLELKKRHPNVRLMGPAHIDFEYHHLLATLRRVPAESFDALSHHLYVDRRGAPENRQGGFSAVEKFALARAIARHSPACADRLIVSEVNWPLAGTGVYSPVCSPYLFPGQVVDHPNVSETDYADFMLRYLALAVCSGFVDRVYWWRLAARGFGLIDDLDPENWRKRPAFHALRHFLQLLSGTSFVEKLSSPPGTYLLWFESLDGKRTVMAWSAAGPAAIECPFALDCVLDREGRPVPQGGPRLELGGSPRYAAVKIPGAGKM